MPGKLLRFNPRRETGNLAATAAACGSHKWSIGVTEVGSA